MVKNICITMYNGSLYPLNFAINILLFILGITFTEKWNTDNVLATDISLTDFCEGAKLSCDTSFVPHSGYKSIL